MADPTGNGFKIPGALNEWLKIIVFLVSLGMFYAKITDQLSAHTSQIGEISNDIKEMRGENKRRNIDVQKKLGSIDMYLCSKDSTHCSANAPSDSDQ